MSIKALACINWLQQSSAVFQLFALRGIQTVIFCAQEDVEEESVNRAIARQSNDIHRLPPMCRTGLCVCIANSVFKLKITHVGAANTYEVYQFYFFVKT